MTQNERTENHRTDRPPAASLPAARPAPQILLEIQDTIRGADARGPVRPMKRAVNVSLSVMTAFYVAVAVSGYAVFGDTAANQFGILIPDDILEGFPGPVWVVNLANALVLVGRRARGA